METVYEKVLGELAIDNEKFDLGDILKHQSSSHTGSQHQQEADIFNSGLSDSQIDKRSRKEGEFVEQEQTQEEAEFFQGMISIESSDAQPTIGTDFNFQFESKHIETAKNFEIEPPKEDKTDMSFNFGDTTPHKHVLENNIISSYNSTINFEYSEKNTPGTQSPNFQIRPEPDQFFKKNQPNEERSRFELQPDHISKPPEVETTQMKQLSEVQRPEQPKEPLFIIPNRNINLFDDDEPDTVVAPPQDNQEEVWDFNKRQESPYAPPSALTTPSAPDTSQIVFNFSNPPVEQYRPKTPEQTVRNPFPAEYSIDPPKNDFEFAPPREDKSIHQNDFGFGKFESGWKKQKHNLLDNDPLPPQVHHQHPVQYPRYQETRQANSFVQEAFTQIPQTVYYLPPIRHPQPVMMQPIPFQTSKPLDNFDLLSMRVNTTLSSKTPFDEEIPDLERNKQIQPEMPPIIIEKIIVEKPKPKIMDPFVDPEPLKIVKPSLNNFKLSQLETLSFREEGGRESCELFGSLSIKANDPASVFSVDLGKIKGSSLSCWRYVGRSQADEIMGTNRERNESKHGHSILSRVQ